MSSPESSNEPQETLPPDAETSQPASSAAEQGEHTAAESAPPPSAEVQQPPSGQGDPAPQIAPAPRPQIGPRPPFVPREERERRRREALAGLVVGEWREGKVTGIAAFGAFVDLGGVDGLVHVSQLGTGGYVERVEDVVQVGQVVRVRVAEVDMERGRVSLSMREPRAAAPSRDRGAGAPAPGGAPAPRPARPATPGGGGFTPSWSPESSPETRTDRRSRGGGGSGGGGGERGNFGRGEERGPRRSDRPRRHRDAEDEEWRSVRGDPRNYYSSYGEEEADEPAPTTPEELVARFNRRGNAR